MALGPLAPTDVPYFVLSMVTPDLTRLFPPALLLCFREERTTARSRGGGGTR